jgi:ABC-type spermidine/putrescine transport system permease subunit II
VFLTPLTAAVIAVLLLPLAYAVWMSFAPGELLEPPTGEWSLRWYRAFFASNVWTSGLQRSLIVASISSIAATLFGFGAAWADVRGTHRWLRPLLLLPAATPPIVLGAGMLPLMRNLNLTGTMFGLIASHSVWTMPFAYLIVRAALLEVDADLELAARGLGASPWNAFRRVTLPLIVGPLGAAVSMTFVLSLNEFLISLFLAGPETATLPVVIWPNLRYTLTPLVAAASAITIAWTLAGLAIAAILASRWKRRAAN